MIANIIFDNSISPFLLSELGHDFEVVDSFVYFGFCIALVSRSPLYTGHLSFSERGCFPGRITGLQPCIAHDTQCC